MRHGSSSHAQTPPSIGVADSVAGLERVYLFEVDALPTGVGSCQDLHAAMLPVKARVVGDKLAHAQLLQGVSGPRGGTEMERGRREKGRG